MDAATLQQKVEQGVDAKITANQPFTMVDISHPIIKADPTVRHRQVRSVIEALASNGKFDNAMYTSSPITVYPQPNKPVQARLFHPDDPSFDVNSYTATNQELHRDQASAPANVITTRGYDMTDTDGDNGSNSTVQMVSSTVTGAPVTKQCFVQSKGDTLNIPRTIVKAAGFAVGDSINVTDDNGSLRIEKATSGRQKVDQEGRIRLHGDNIGSRANGTACTAVVVAPASGGSYIQIQ